MIVPDGSVPRVGVAMPVYNGQNFVEEAISSILGQTFEDLELVICDNASTDRTEEICRSFAARDDRVRYYRNTENLGAVPNYRKVMSLTRAPYVKWAAHDDVCLPGFVETCIRVLDDDPSVVLAHTAAASIDEKGQIIKTWSSDPGLADEDPATRFRAALNISEEIFLFWGMVRADVLRRVPPIGGFVGHDRPMLTALALQGRVHLAPEVLFQQREHPDRSVRAHDWRRPRDAVGWYDASKTGKLIFPTWRLLGEHARSVLLSPVAWKTKSRCLRELARWAGDSRQALRWDLALAAERTPRVGGRIVGLFDQAVKTVRREIREGEAFILIDDATMEIDIFGNRVAVPFIEKSGTYWGPPPDGETAISELERLRERGVALVVIASNCFWWLDHYPAFAAHLHRYPTIYTGKDFVIRDLRRSALEGSS